MTKALVLGISGQDGSYLAEFLLTKRYDVVGVTRDSTVASGRLPATLRNRVALEEWDMTDGRQIADVIARHRPAEMYNLAARASGSGMYDAPAEMGIVNGIAVTHILEALRTIGLETRFCQASSSEMFGEPINCPQSETTPFRPRSPYGAAKLYAHAMVDVYRRQGVFATSAILFNHESPRRPLHYVTRKVSRAAASIRLGIETHLELGNLGARRDWGYAGDYVRALWTMLQQPVAEDYVIATGVTHSVRDLCKIAFDHVGLDYREFVRSSPATYRPDEQVELVGDPSKANARLDWYPTVGFEELIRQMVDADLAELRNAVSPSHNAST